MKTLIITYLILVISTLSVTAQKNSSKKILMILPMSGFSEYEYTESKRIFEENNFTVKVASTSLSSAIGINGITIKPEVLLKDVNIDNYTAIVFPGGSGVQEFYSDTVVLQIIKQTVERDLVLGAISTAPRILAKAGILGNCNVTGTYLPILEDCGATYTGSKVEVSGKIITAENTVATEEFAHSIIKALMQTD